MKFKGRIVDDGGDGDATTPVAPVSAQLLADSLLIRSLRRRTTALVATVAVFLSASTAFAGFLIQLPKLDSRLYTSMAVLAPNPGLQWPEEIAGFGLLHIERSSRSGLLETQVFQIPTGVTPEAITQLLADLPSNGEASTRMIEGGGLYRVLAVEQGDQLAVTGLPLSEVINPLVAQLIVSALLILCAIGLSQGFAGRMVENSLRDIASVAARHD